MKDLINKIFGYNDEDDDYEVIFVVCARVVLINDETIAMRRECSPDANPEIVFADLLSWFNDEKNTTSFCHRSTSNDKNIAVIRKDVVVRIDLRMEEY